MDKLVKKTLQTSRGMEYTYYAPSAIQPQLPTLFLLHGFPDHAHMWDGVVDHIAAHSPVPYNVVAPDLLGYGGSSKPTSPDAYAFSALAADLAEVLDAEGVARAVVVGHDWGASLAQHFMWLHRGRVCGLVLLSVAYLPFGRAEPKAVDVAAINAAGVQAYGYPQYEYWNLFTAPDAGALLSAQLDRFYEVLHGDAEHWMRDMFCTPGAMRAFLEGEHPRSGSVTLRPFAQAEKRRREFQRFASQGFQAPLQWYVSFTSGAQVASAKMVKPEVLRADLPVLFIGSTDDDVCRHEIIEIGKSAGLLPDLEEHVLQGCGHWIPMERPDELGHLLLGFLAKKFPAAS